MGPSMKLLLPENRGASFSFVWEILRKAYAVLLRINSYWNFSEYLIPQNSYIDKVMNELNKKAIVCIIHNVRR